MISPETNAKVIAFFEDIPKYYGCRAEITQGLYTRHEQFDASLATWNLSEFVLLRSAYRNNGDRLMMEGDNMYYEMSARAIFDFKQPGRNTFEFVEIYSESVFRITKIKFHYRY